MKTVDILDALSDLPEDYITYATRKVASQNESEAVQDAQPFRDEIILKRNKTEKHAPVRISKTTAAAAVAVCIGLNAAMIYGISTMRKDFGSFTPTHSMGVQNTDPLHIELIDAMPTGVSVTYQNQSETTCEIPLLGEILRNGKKLESITIKSNFEKMGVFKLPLEPNQSVDMIFSFDELPPGTYTLMTFDMDGKTPSAFGSIDFEISEGYMEMIYIPDMTGMQSEAAVSQLNDLNISYDIVNTLCNDEETGRVIKALPTPYKTVENAGVQQQYYHYDGNGYWIKPTDRVQLEIAISEGRDPVMLPDMVGWDYEVAKDTILNMDLYIDKSTAYSDEVEKDKVISINPEGPLEVDRYSTICVVVSLGPNDDEMYVDETGPSIDENNAKMSN